MVTAYLRNYFNYFQLVHVVVCHVNEIVRLEGMNINIVSSSINVSYKNMKIWTDNIFGCKTARLSLSKLTVYHALGFYAAVWLSGSVLF